MGKYLLAWENHYGDVYHLTPLEKDWYNKLSEDEQILIGRIFDYCEENKLFKSITPRLALFMKSKQRFNQLREFCKDIPEEIVCVETEEEEKSISLEDEIEILENEIRSYEDAGDTFAANLRKSWLAKKKDNLNRVKLSETSETKK